MTPFLRNNKIKKRYYAIDPATGKTTHTNAELAAAAVRELTKTADFNIDDIGCLACGTSAPDQLMPAHASMVHGELANKQCEIVSTAGICLSGVTALKYAAMTVATGQHKYAVATGSEQASSFMRARLAKKTESIKEEELNNKPALAFDADFLRWMLSDGAGATLLSSTPATTGISLKIDWIEITSHANDLDTCMYAGAVKRDDATIKGWREFASLDDAVAAGAFLVKQDAKLLNREVIPALVNRSLPAIIEKYNLTADDITWFLPHYSSDYFKMIVYDHLAEIDFEIPMERWFTNLETKGNTGSASFYIILEEIFKSGRLKKGDRLLCFIPESGRFSVGYVMFTVV